MNFKILVPFWGTDPRYIKLLREWYEAYTKSGCHAPVSIISDQHTPAIPGEWTWQSFTVPEQNKTYQFDHKGNIVCAAVQSTVNPVLIVDSDAVFQGNPATMLESFAYVPFAMPEDEGARGRKLRNRHAQEGQVAKRCAGVLWFGGGKRVELVHDYRQAFADLETGRYYEERRLFEQHAWSMVAHKHKAPMLPRVLNWPDHITSVGPNPEALINHRIGQRKFNVAFAKK